MTSGDTIRKSAFARRRGVSPAERQLAERSLAQPVARTAPRLDLDFDRMRELWEGHPEITAKVIGERFGISKNAVIGHASRKQWAARGETPEPPPKPPRAEFPSSGHCVFPIGDPRQPEFRFCGIRHGNFDRPYCEQHHAIACVPQRHAREAAE